MKVKITGFKPRKWQEDTLRLVDGLQPMEVLTIVSGRQRGKSLIISVLLIKIALEKAGSESYYITPTSKQARHFYKSLIKKLPPEIIKVSNAQILEIELINGSMITLLSGESGDNLRGYTVKKGGVLVYDEAAYLKDSVFEDTRPYVNVSKANIIQVSTPKFKSGKFYEAYINGKNGIKGYKSINWGDYDTSEFLSEEAKEQYKREYTRFKYLTDIEGVFIDLDGTVFTGIDRVISDDELLPEGNLYMAIDFGSGNGGDNTAITILNSKKELCYIEAFNTLTPTEQVEKISRIIDKYKPFKVTAEINSIGRVYLDLLRKKHKIDEWTTTNQSKQEIIAELQKAIECQEITIPRDDDLLTELSSYDMEITKSGKITYNGNNCKDDRVMSLAICLRSLSVRKVQYRFAY